MAFAPDSSLERLQGLHRDLCNLAESRLPSIERLWAELEAQVDAFRALLDKKPKNDQSRQALSSGTITIDEVEYSVNDEFQQDVVQLADALDLDELDAARVYLQSLEDAATLDRTALASSVIIFHSERQTLLECLRLCCQHAPVADDKDSPFEDADELALQFKALLSLVTQSKEGAPGGGSQFWQKCIQSMADTEAWLQRIAERVHSMAVTGQAQSPEFAEVMAFQRSSLVRQHESLGSIAYHLVRGCYTTPDDLRFLLARLRKLDRYDVLLVDYLPTLASSLGQFGLSDSFCTLRDARSLHSAITSTKDDDAWSLRSFRAATIAIWMVYYSGRYLDNPSGSPLQDVDLDAELDQRGAQFMEALRDGAFEFLLSVSRDAKKSEWPDPVRGGLTENFLKESPALLADPFTTQPDFQETLMEQFQGFVDAYITYMPDSLRRLKFEEDEQRRQMQGFVQLRSTEMDLHLERFLLLTSYAFEGFPVAAESFWSDTDGNLYGFLQWASQRQSTPRVAAFCEMLRALSEGASCADAAHRFLLDDSHSSRLRRNSPLSWAHIFREFEFYSTHLSGRSSSQQDKAQAENLVEPESAMMLECYLRLTAHLCRESPAARNWLVHHPSFQFPEHLLLLCSGSGETRIRACAFSALTALLTDKTKEVQDGIWTAVDAWISGAPSQNANAAAMRPSNAGPVFMEQFAFSSMSAGFEEPNAFVVLLQALVRPLSTTSILYDALPFPESLGAAYRMPGIEPYVDFALGDVFATKAADLQDPSHLRLVRCSCLYFASTCLATFNEDLVVFANQSSISVDSAIQTSNLATYARIHPFARVMEWFFNDKVITALFASVDQDVAIVNEALFDSPLIIGIMRGIEVIHMVLSQQATYLDVVRPIIKLQSTSRRPVANSALASFEDAVLNNLSFVTKLGLYCGCGHQELAIASLKLLQRLSSSRKLSAPLAAIGGRQPDKSRLITALERNDEVEGIARSMISQMQFDSRELELGPDSPGHAIKYNIIALLNSCIEAVPDRPTIAQLLLGFKCYAQSLSVADNSLFSGGRALLHSIVRFVAACPIGDEDTILFWLIDIKNQAMQVLHKLLASHMSRDFALPELRSMDFMAALWSQQTAVGPGTLWEGRVAGASEFYLSDSALAYTTFLQLRSAFLGYVADEAYAAKFEANPTLKRRIQSSLLGTTTFADGHESQNITMFDMLDFLELDLGQPIALPESKYLDLSNMDICRSSHLGQYDLTIADQLLLLRMNEVQKAGSLTGPNDQQQVEADFENVMLCLKANNRQIEIHAASTQLLSVWARTVAVALECCDFEADAKNVVIFQTMQMILPRFERSLGEEPAFTLILANLSRSLLQHIDVKLVAESAQEGMNSASTQLAELYRGALIAIQRPEASNELRRTCCYICHAYLTIISAPVQPALLRKGALHAFKSVGPRLLEAICDDAYGDEGEAKTAALLLLGSLVAVSNRERSRHLLDALARLDAVPAMAEALALLAPALAAARAGTAAPLAQYHAGAAVLLRVAQTRAGAALVLHAGFFAALRRAGLFAADPDLGLAGDGGAPLALARYFALLRALLRIVVAVVLSAGPDNDYAVAQARAFLRENRACVVAVLKRSAGIGDARRDNEEVLLDLVDGFTVLIAACGFLEDHEERPESRQAPSIFT